MGNNACYFCGKNAPTKEHFPPKAFFPNNGENLQLKTVPSCHVHNNEKSDIDQYVLAHITLNQGHDLNLARRRFDESIKPRILTNRNFKKKISRKTKISNDGSVQYSVDTSNFNPFFDALSKAVLFDKYNQVLPDEIFTISHTYLSLKNSYDDMLARAMAYNFFLKNKPEVEERIHDYLDEFVYRSKIMAPLGYAGSITILHTFYESFDVLTLASNKQAMGMASLMINDRA